MSSEGSNERTGLGHGLPRLLADDPNTLNDLLGLSRQERLRIGTLVPKAVRARIDAALKSRPEPPRPGERDRVLVQVHYQHPLVRQAAWYVALERGPGGKPSPEATVLADFVAAERDTREGTTEASADDRTESERIADRAWSATRERLGRWEELDEPEREQCTLRAFAVATIRDDAGVLVEACELVSDLREQFGRFLPEPEDDAADSRPEAERASHRWVNLTRSLRELMERAEGPPPNPDLLPDITSALESLRELAPSVRAETDRTAFDLFLHEVREQLSEIQSDSTFGLDEGRSAEIQAAWEQQRGALAGETLRKARHQFNAAVGGAVNEMRRAAQDLAEVKDRIAQHRAEEPDDPFGQDAWDEHLEDLQRAERRGRKRRRDARSALLTALAPAGVPISPAAKTPPAKPNEPKPEPPESEPPGSAPPEPERPQPAPPESKVPKPEPPEAEPPQAEQPPPESPGQQPPEFEPLEPAPPEPELPETPSAEAPKRDPLAVKAEEAITAALVEQPPRLAYAFQVARLSERVVPGEWSSPSALIEAALLADRLELPDGVIAGRLGELFQVFPALTAADKSGDERAFSTAAAFAGSVLPAVFAPNTGAFAILASIPATRPFPFLPELARRVATHAEKLQRARIDASHLNALRSDEERDAARAQSGQALSEWLRDAPRRTMLYAPATAVWKRWLEPNGAIGGLMARIEAENGPRFRAEIGQLRDAGYVKDLVEKTHRELRAGAARRTPIRWRALEKLVHEARRAAELAERYLAHAVPSGSVDFRVEVLTDLRRELDTFAPDAARKCLGCPARFSGAARLVIGAVRRLQAALHPSGDVDAGTEPDPRELRASGFFGTTVVLDEDGEPVGTPRDLLVSLTEQEPLDPVDAVRAHLDRGSLGTARRILDWVAGAGPPGLADIEAEFESARVRHAADRKQQLAPLRARLETGLRLGTISADEREQINADLVGAEHQLSNPDFLRFAELRRRLEGIESGLATMEESSRKRIRHELAGLALGPDSPSAAAIQRAIDDGDIVAANELIQRVREDPAVLITDEEASDGRRAFSPDTATTIAAALENAGSPREVMRRIAAGHSFAGVPGDLPEARRESAARMLTAWFTLKRSRVIGAGGTGSVASLFSEIGFRVRDVEPGDGSTSEVRLRTDPLRSRDQCPVPAYGSAAGGRYRVIGVWRQPTIDDLLRFADEPGAAPPVVLYFGRLSEQQRTRLALATRERAQAILVLDEPAVLFLCGVRDSRLSVFFDCTLPFSYVQPYSAVGGAAPPEMFYGRDTELASITSRNGPCFVYGGRQIGKTAILRRARDREHRPADGRYVFFVDLKAQGIGVEGSVADLWRLLWRLLRDENAIPKDVREPVTKGRGRIEEFLDALIRHFDPDSGRTLLLLLDEADNFLAMDAREQQRDLAATGFRESNRLKRLMDETQRSIKVVFAGLHNVLRTVEQANHPLGQFGRPVQVRPLLRNGGERAARDLAIRPLRAAGYRFDPQDLVTRILGQTNYYPGLIQAYCAELIEAMLPRCAGAPPYSVTPEVLAAAYRADGLREFIRKRFHLTLELDKRYEVIAYVTAWLCLEEEGVLATGIARRRLLDQVRDWWPAGFGDLNDEEFGALLDETVGLGVLRRAKPDGTAYTLRNPNVLLLMGTKDEIEAKLLQEPEPPQDLEPRILRARRNPNDPEDPLRSPLTFRQQRQLFAEEDGVILLAGVPAAGLDDVLEAHESLPERPLVRLDGALDREFFRSGLSGSVKRQEEGVRVHAVPPEALWTDEWVQDAERHLKRLRKSDRHVRVLFLAAGDRVAALLADEGLRKMPRLERIYLQPWHEGFVRQWMQDVGVGDSADLRARILDLTGGWPLALMRIPDLLRVHGVAERALDDLDHEFADPGQQRDWLHHLCLEDPVTRRVLRPIATFEELSRQDALDEAVADGLDREEAETRLRAAGHLGLARSTPTWSLNPLVARLLKDEQSD